MNERFPAVRACKWMPICASMCCPIPNPHGDAWSAAAADTLLSQTAASAMLRAKEKERLEVGGLDGWGLAALTLQQKTLTAVVAHS